MSKKKKAATNSGKVNPPVDQKAPPPPTNKEPKEEGVLVFYIKAAVVAAVFYWGINFIIGGYVDMNNVYKISQRMQQNDNTLTAADYELYNKGVEYSNSKNFEWFHGYKWVNHTFIKMNRQNLMVMDTFDLDEKRSAKSGINFNYLRIIRDNTPEDAVIIMPDRSMVPPENAPANTPKFTDVYNKPASLYFLYPRTLVYDEKDAPVKPNGEENQDVDPDYEEKRKNATHVAILYGQGYEKLNYNVPPQQREYYTVLPIEAPASDNNQSNQ